MSIATRLFSMKNPHCGNQEEVTMVTIPNTKARIDNAIGTRHWVKLFDRL